MGNGKIGLIKACQIYQKIFFVAFVVVAPTSSSHYSSSQSTTTQHLPDRRISIMDGSASDNEANVAACSVPKVVLSVMNLKYSHPQNIVARTFQADESALLENVTFSANSGELMAILAPRDAERR
jgi:hypothetical protein